MLDVKLPTLYAYVSRGLIRSVAAERGRLRRYSRADVERLRARRDARRGHGPVAAGALRWGEPVLDSSITEMGPQGPRYRGLPAVDLAREGRSFESVAELLWTGEPAAPDHRWPVATKVPLPRRLVDGARPAELLSLAVPAAALGDPDRFSFDLSRARELLGAMALALGGSGVTLAELAVSGLGGRSHRRATRAIDMVLIAVADHELNVSTFACRVTASAGANLYACVSAGLAALSGARHGGMCDRVEALVAECPGPEQVIGVVRERARRGEEIPGFGHPLYPAGDPRGALLLGEAARLAPRNRQVAAMLAIARAVKRAHRHGPNIDFGMVAVAHALRLRAGAAAGLFALGRTAGWIAHALEQREAGFMLRPRARYVPPKGT